MIRVGGVLSLLVLLCAGAVAEAQLPRSPFTVVCAPDTAPVPAGGSVELHCLIRVPPHHYLYREKTAIEFHTLEGLRIKAIRYPEAERKYDPFFDRELEIFDQDVDIGVVVEAPATLATGARELAAAVTYQGCSEKLCYRLETTSVQWALQVDPVAGPPLEIHQGQVPEGTDLSTVDDSSWRRLMSLPDFRGILVHGIGIAYLITFLGGILTAFTPCVLPLIPVILLIIGIHPGAHRRNLFLAGCLSTGLALTYALLGLIGALAGLPLSFLFQQRWFLALLVLFYLAMAVSMFGFFSLQLPRGVQQRLQQVGGKGPAGAFLAGVSTGLLATPCAGPVIGALIAYVGTQRDIGFGFSLLFTYGAGFGLIFLFLGTFYGTLTQRIRRPAVAKTIKVLLGVFLLLPAGYYGWALVGETTWQASEPAAYAQARALNRPVFIEVGAKTCPPCLVLERTTLKDPRVVRALAEAVVPLKIDATFTTPEIERLLQRYRVVGWPTLLLASPTGEVYWDLSLVGEIPSPEELLRVIDTARRRVSHP